MTIPARRALLSAPWFLGALGCLALQILVVVGVIGVEKPGFYIVLFGFSFIGGYLTALGRGELKRK